MQIGLEIVFPFHPIVEPAQLILRVRRVDRDEMEVGVFERDDTSFMVVLVDTDSVADIHRMMLRIDGRSAVAFLVGIVPIALISIELQVELSGLHLRFLKAEEVCVQLTESLFKLFSDSGTQTVHVP